MFINPPANHIHIRERQTSTEYSAKEKSAGLDTGAAVGIGIGILLFIAMCIGTGYWACIGRRKKESSEEEEIFANRPRSASYGSESAMVRRKTSVKTPPMMELPIPITIDELTSMDFAEIEDYSAPGQIHQVDDPATEDHETLHSTLLPYPSRPSTLKLPNPRFDSAPPSPVPQLPQSPSQWSLFPKEDRPNTAGSSRYPRIADPKAASEVSLRKFAPVPVKVMPSPTYAVSEYASIYQKRLSNLSLVEPVPTPPPEHTRTLPRPMSFRTFLAQAQAQGRTRLHPQQKGHNRSLAVPVASTRSPGISSKSRNRLSHRTSLKSYIGRNGLGDEGIFVATSDDPEVPFTLFRWPNDSGSSGSSKRSNPWPK